MSASSRSAADVAREYAVSWWSVNHALVVKAAGMTGRAPGGVRRLGVDETRARSVRWLLAEHGWRRSDPWMTSFVDLDPSRPGGCSDRLHRAVHQFGEADLLHEPTGFVVVVEDPAAVLVDDQHLVPVGLEPGGGVGDPRTDAEDGVKQCDVGHAASLQVVGDSRRSPFLSLFPP